MNYKEIIDLGFEFFDIEKRELKKRSNLDYLKKIVAIFYVANKYESNLNLIAKKLEKHRTTMYHYIDLLKPNNQFLFFKENIDIFQKVVKLWDIEKK